MRKTKVAVGGLTLCLALPIVLPVAGASEGSRPGGKRPSVRSSRDRVVVPAGTFTMGSDPHEGNRDEVPAHQPKIDRFAIDRHEVTNRQYRACVERGPCSPPADRGSKTRPSYYGDPAFAQHPVVNVDWYQASQYCRWRGGRLPTEAEWEKAARGARDRRKYPWGDREPDCTLANFGGPDGCAGDTDRVGARPAGKSPYGALDMAGNVWEWVGDWYDPAYYKRSPTHNPRGPRWGAFKVMRGGCYDTAPDGLRVSCRNRDFPSSRRQNVGFRCVESRR